jgi:hypothetical protein
MVLGPKSRPRISDRLNNHAARISAITANIDNAEVGYV